MRIGVVFPQTEIGPDVAAVRAYGEAVEEMGYQHILAYDHVVGADPAVHKAWNGPYDVDTQFHEPFVMFGYLAACTSLELVTGITILPQRPTALVAKQAAEVDLLTGGKFRLGVGIGWNAVEYEALGQDFSVRGRRLEEQVTLLRRLWTEHSVSVENEFDRVDRCRLGSATRAAPHPDLVRRFVDEGLRTDGATCGRLDAPGPTGTEAGRGPGDHRRRGGEGRS